MSNQADPEFHIGLMTGTSLDAVDAALVQFDGDTTALVRTRERPLPEPLRQRILATGPDTPLRGVCALDAELALLYAEVVGDLIGDSGVSANDIRAIGCHGQTVWHAPDENHPVSVQLGDPARLSEAMGITVVSDFRRRDLAAGGQGAPLAPAFHHALFARADEFRVVVNLGGMANITLLPGADRAEVSGFDTGPGNVLMDAWIRRRRDERFDVGGSWAAAGRVVSPLLEAMLDEPYFRLSPPKSTGRETFDLPWLDRHLDSFAGLAPEDVQATLCELTAATVANAVRAQAPACERLLLAGGGAANGHLRRRLAARLEGIPVEPTDGHGVPATWVEATGFAWLARETLAGRPGNIPAVTGARHPVVLGAIHPGGHVQR